MFIELLIKDTVSLTVSKLTKNVVGLLFFRGFSSFFYIFLKTNLDTIVSFVPLAEWSSINEHNSTLHKSLSTHKFVVGSVVDDIQNTGLASCDFSTPRKVTGIQAKSTELEVTTTDTNGVDTLMTKLGVSWLTSRFEFTLFTELITLTTSVATLMTRITRNT